MSSENGDESGNEQAFDAIALDGGSEVRLNIQLLKYIIYCK